jgi:uncharacterized protein YndB with AHSA1/START domain
MADCTREKAMEIGVSAQRAEAPAVERGGASRRGLHPTVRVSRRLRKSPQRVFDAWLDPEIAGRWLFATASRPVSRVRIDGRVGGAFRFVESGNAERIEHTGIYFEIARPRRLGFTLAAANQQHALTRVVAEIVPRKTGCELVVRHEGVPEEHAARVESRWTGMLYGLCQALESR